ncbi:unnamed protein product [Protopolystoma xenopodis]|uniref:Uncharacterized protein n=1 Tax=Protopolystoma xenopodis TaxID=117903 RepID=A0A448XCG7_9PLAT|nr:unnamed protein product [Protopolystoma xenopodis]
MDYLALIEERINLLLLVRQFIAANDPEAPYVAKTILIGNNLTPVPGPIQPIMPPNLQEDFDELTEIHIIKPFSREELHQRVVSLVLKKERDSRAVGGQSISFKESGLAGKPCPSGGTGGRSTGGQGLSALGSVTAGTMSGLSQA